MINSQHNDHIIQIYCPNLHSHHIPSLPVPHLAHLSTSTTANLFDCIQIINRKAEALKQASQESIRISFKTCNKLIPLKYLFMVKKKTKANNQKQNNKEYKPFLVT